MDIQWSIKMMISTSNNLIKKIMVDMTMMKLKKKKKKTILINLYYINA
jgi:hypothetical protein